MDALQNIKLDYIEWAFHVPVLVVVLLSIFCGRKAFWIAQGIIYCVLGLAFIAVPKFIIAPHISGGKPDIIHEFLLRLFGTLWMGYGISWLLSRNSSDARMTGSQLFTKIVGSICLCVAAFFSAYHLYGRKGIRFNEKFIAFYCGLYFLSGFGSMVHAIRGGEIGGYNFKADWLNVGLQLDHAALLIIALIDFAFPSQVLKLLIKNTTIDGVHLCIVRMMAALGIAISLTSSSAAGFAFPGDKKSHVLGRMLTHVLIFGLNLFGHFYLDIFTMFHVTPFMISGFYITFILTLFFRFEKEKQR